VQQVKTVTVHRIWFRSDITVSSNWETGSASVENRRQVVCNISSNVISSRWTTCQSGRNDSLFLL